MIEFYIWGVSFVAKYMFIEHLSKCCTTVKFGNKDMFSYNVKRYWNVWPIEGIIVYLSKFLIINLFNFA